MKRVRQIFQISFLLMVVITGYRYSINASLTSIEEYCPFGGLEAVASLLTHRQFTCATGEKNLALFLALVLLTFIARKAFCSWICPIGTISEFIYSARIRLRGIPRTSSGKLAPENYGISSQIDRKLRLIRYPILILILYLTYKTGELIFRAYDPYYIIFSFHGHDVMAVSYIVLAVIFAGIILIPMAWCRYLCPLGAALWPISSIARIRICRENHLCTHCNRCDLNCPQLIPISQNREVKSGDCTLCLNCVDSCAKHGALTLKIK